MGNHKVLKTAGINLRYSMYDFIYAVKKHQIIWDRGHENFHNRELRDQAWQQIGQQLCKNFDSANSGEKQEIAKTLLKRWKNTRDSYLRVNRLRQNGDEISRASYIYEKELSFLLEVRVENEDAHKQEIMPKAAATRKQFQKLRTPVKRRRESDSQCIAQQDSNAIVECQLTADQKNISSDGLHTVLETLNCSTDTTASPEVGTTNSKGDSSTTIPIDLNCTGNSSTPASATTLGDPDPDQAFFDSIKPHMQRMSSDQKLDFQIEVLKILRQFKPISH